MAGVKEFLKRQASIPESIERQLPSFAPKVSKVLSAIADTLPNAPRSSTPKSLKIREFVSSIEEKMPEVLPRFTVEEKPTPTFSPSLANKLAPAPRSRVVYGADKRGTLMLTDDDGLI